MKEKKQETVANKIEAVSNKSTIFSMGSAHRKRKKNVEKKAATGNLFFPQI